MSNRTRRGSQSLASGRKNKRNQTRVHLLDTCYICGNNYSSARQTIGHVQRIHGYRLPTRQVGHNRPLTKDYEYIRERDEKYDEEHFACPSCWFHCPVGDIEELNEHTRDEHDPEQVDPTKEEDDGYASTGSRPNSNRSSRRGSRSGTPGKQNNEQNGKRSNKNGENDITEKLNELADLFKTFFNGK